MTRADFMRRLEELLSDVTPAEREEAIQYYNDYFDDAGAENEQSVIASLGSPETLARTIKAGLADGGNTGEFTEKGFSGYEQIQNHEVMNLNHRAAENGAGNSGYYENGSRDTDGRSNTSYKENDRGVNFSSEDKKQKSNQMSGGMIALIVILCILASPFLIGLAGSLFGIIVGIFAALFGIVLGFGITSVVLLIVGVCLFIYGIVLLFGAPLGGLCMIGGALICAAVGLLFFWLTVIICGALIPVVIRGIVKLFQNIFHKGGARA